MEKKNTRRFPWALAIFLCLYITLTSVAVIVLGQGKTSLEPQPTQTTSAEPDHAAVFDRLFAEPDWAQLYTLAGAEDTEFEGSNAYAAYMRSKVGEKALTYYEVRTDLADTHRYLVFLGNEKIAAFTMSGAPNWDLDELELFFERKQSVLVETSPEHTVFVNGVALDDRFTVRTLETKAEKYLPEGVHGLRRRWQMVTGLLATPEVTALDPDGNPVNLERDEETGIYRVVDQATSEITAQEAALARKAAIADAQYAIGAISNVQLKAYFDENSPLYKMLITNPRNLQKYTSASIDENAMRVSEYCRYSDTMFSVNVKLTQKIIRTTGTLKTYQADKTYFFTKIGNDYRVTAYTNEHVTETVEQVRLSFVTESGTTGQMICTDDAIVTPPAATAPQGQELVGWATKTMEEGTITMTVRILPDGTVLGGLEPMELYPVFQPIDHP